MAKQYFTPVIPFPLTPSPTVEIYEDFEQSAGCTTYYLIGSSNLSGSGEDFKYIVYYIFGVYFLCKDNISLS